MAEKNKTTEDLEGTVAEGELEAVKDIVASLLLALKNQGLYPHDHVLYKNAVKNVITTLSAFLSRHGDLRLDTNKDSLLFRDEVAYQSQPEALDLPFVLFRDGIQWLEFQNGLEGTVIRELIDLLFKYKDSLVEAEGDLVTALWEADFPNIRYKAVDVYWEGETLLDISTLDVQGEEHETVEEQEEPEQRSLAVMVQDQNQTLLSLTDLESAELRTMVLQDEARNAAQDLVDVVSVFLNDQTRSDDLETVLGFLEDEVQDTLRRGEFLFACKLFRSLGHFRKTSKTEKSWAVPTLDAFLRRITHPQKLRVLSDWWLSPSMVDEDRMKRLEQFLILLPANTIVVLGPMLSQVRFPRVQEHLMKIIGTLAKRDLRPLERLLSSSDDAMVERLVFILGHLGGKRPKEILSQMMNHQSDRVRRQALRQLLSRDSDAIEGLFHLIDDSSTSIRNLILDNLGRNRDKKGEGLLVGYLKKQSFGVDTQEHLLACYKTLGRCGSSRSLQFLRGLLLERSGLLDRNKSIHRQGAAIALMGIGTEEAKDILKNASRSLMPGVRSACRKALEANG